MTQDPEILTTVSVSAPRRYFGVGVLGALGLVLLWIVFKTPPATLPLTLFLGASGVVALWGATHMWRSAERALVLTTNALTDDQGLLLAKFDDIMRVERGMLAFKPSNGFVVTLKSKGKWAWSPGLYWRFGRKIGVGGVTAASQAKAMADILSMRLAERDSN